MTCKRLVLDINWSGNVGGYMARYCMYDWNDFYAMLARQLEIPNYPQTVKPRIKIVHQS